MIVRRLSFNWTHRSGGIANNDTPRCGEVSRILSPKVNKLQNRLSIADERGHTEAVLERHVSLVRARATRTRDLSLARGQVHVATKIVMKSNDVERGRPLARVTHESDSRVKLGQILNANALVATPRKTNQPRGSIHFRGPAMRLPTLAKLRFRPFVWRCLRVVPTTRFPGSLWSFSDAFARESFFYKSSTL